MSDSETIEKIQKRRADRRDGLLEEREAQYCLDLEEVDKLEVEHGDSNIAIVNVPFTPGLPTLAVCKCPSPALIKRYRDRVKKGPKGQEGDSVGGANELGKSCLVYPDKETFDQMVQARPLLSSQLGVCASGLAAGKEEEDLKD